MVDAANVPRGRAGRGYTLHAYRNPVRIWDLGDGLAMMVGPSEAAIFIEVGT